MLLSSGVLGLSAVVSGWKLVLGFAHADPRSLARAGRRALLVAGLASVPCLMALLAFQQWTAAMVLGAGMLIAPALFNWRGLFARLNPRRSWADQLWDDVGPLKDLRGDFGQPPPDADLARRAAIVLEDYLAREAIPLANPIRRAPVHEASGKPPMDADEARAVLGLEPGCTASSVRDAHRRLMQLVHPDRGGSNYLAAKINEAKDRLLSDLAARPMQARPRASPRTRARTSPRQTAGTDD